MNNNDILSNYVNKVNLDEKRACFFIKKLYLLPEVHFRLYTHKMTNNYIIEAKITK